MVEIGSVIRGRVSRIEAYGVYLQHGDDTVIVLAPELSWVPVRSTREFTRLGEELEVFVMGYNYKTHEIIGSIRRLHQDNNPYRELSRLEPGTRLHGKIVFADSVSFCVELPNHAIGSLPRIGSNGVKKNLGDDVEVAITQLDVDAGRLSLELATSMESQTVVAGKG